MNRATGEMLAAYYAGLSVKQVAKRFGVSTGKMYYLLRDTGCEFRNGGHPIGWQPSKETRERMSENRKGIPVSDETRKRISKAKKSHFNGLNGFGHTKIHKSGYVLAYAPMHPKAMSDGYVMLHTLTMEQSIGRYLYSDEVVHHKNHIRCDNRIENLELMIRHDHCSMHMKERHNKERMIQN